MRARNAFTLVELLVVIAIIAILRKAGDNFSIGAQARSRHPGGVNACFADGHVQFVNESISQRTWVLLQSIDDGQVIGEEF